MEKVFTRQITLDKSSITITLHFGNLAISGYSFGSRYLQFGEQKKADCSLIVGNYYSGNTSIPLSEWKKVICRDSNLLKVERYNENNSISDEHELFSRLEDEFKSYTERISMTRAVVDRHNLDNDTYYSVVRYKIPDTGYNIYTIGECSNNISDNISNMPSLITSEDISDISLRPVILSGRLVVSSGRYYVSTASGSHRYISDNEPLVIMIDNSCVDVEFLDIYSTFYL